MAIRIITGIPGAGKSFYAVKHLRDTYFKFNKKENFWFPKDNVKVFANIDNLKLAHSDLMQTIRASGKSLEAFFTVPYQEKIVNKYKKLVYFIDEAQRLFPDNLRDKETLYFFQYHRHLGVDIYLMTQSLWLLPKGIRELIEFEIRAVPRTLSLFGELKYNVRSSGEIIDKKILKKDKKIFNLYKSMDSEESEVIKNPVKKYLVVTVVAVVLSVFLFKNTFFGGVASGGTKSIQSKNGRVEVVRSKETKSIYKKPDYIEKKLNFIRIGNQILIISPITGELVPVKGSGVKTRICVRNGVLRVHGLYTPDEFARLTIEKKEMEEKEEPEKRLWP